MNGLEEIEGAIDRLPPEETRRIAQWLRDRESRRQDEYLGAAYSEMALDTERERNALEWSEGINRRSRSASAGCSAVKCGGWISAFSNDVSNRNLNRLQVVPITSNVGRIYPSEAVVELLGESRKVVADRVATVSKLRLKSKLGNLSSADLLGIERALGIQLGLSLIPPPLPE